MSVTSAPSSPSERALGRAQRDAVRRDRAARRAAKSWRDLTGAEPTLVACSGGADSTALALVLWACRAPMTIAHVVHDMRPREAALADRDFVAGLAGRLGVPFAEREVSVRGRGSVEARARKARYTALARLARDAEIPFVATAHHADDQLETMLMGIARGAGLRGLAASPASRPLAEGLALVRPMLEVTHADSERLCRLPGVEWREDATNTDTTLLRAAVRHGAAAELLRTRPHAAAGAARAAAIVRDAAGLVQDRAGDVFGDAYEWPRATLRRERAIVLGEGLRTAAARLTEDAGMDRLTQRLLAPAVLAVRDSSGERRVFDWPSGLTLTVERDTVRISRG